MPEILGCDFCSVRVEPKWLYPCDDFTMATLGDTDHVSTGGWLACERCGELIEAGSWAALANRSTDEYFKLRGGIAPRAMRRAVHHRIADLHQMFRKHRKNQPRQPIGGTQNDSIIRPNP